MNEKIIESAVEAAARAAYSNNPGRRVTWDEQPENFRDEWRSDVRLIATAALSVAEASIKAQALREGADWLDREARAAGILEPDVEGLDAFQLRCRADLIEVGECE